MVLSSIRGVKCDDASTKLQKISTSFLLKIELSLALLSKLEEKVALEGSVFLWVACSTLKSYCDIRI